MAGPAVAGELNEAIADEVGPAVATDDAALRALLRRSAMPGRVRVAFTREPSLFAADGLAGGQDFTVVARRGGSAVGLGRCTVHTLMRNGVARRIGYLGALRIEPGLPRAARLLRDGYDHLLGQVASMVDGCVTSIASDNLRARRVLERGRGLGLPVYRALGDLVTLVLPVPRLRGRGEGTADGPAPGEERALDRFLAREAGRTHLGLAWDGLAWAGLAGHGVSRSQVRLVRRDGCIVAAGAVWDQRACRQVVIDGYGGALRLARPLVNAALVLAGRPAFPPPGTVLAQGALLGATVSEPGQWPALWAVLTRRAATMGLDWVSLSRDARDPELPVIRRICGAREYRTTLYDVRWTGGPAWPDGWDDRVFRPEVSLL